MKAMRRWIKRAFFMQKKIIELEKENITLARKAEKWRRQYVVILEHNIYLQGNVDSLCKRLEEESDS